MRGQEKNKYFHLQTKELEAIKASGKRPSLLMHTCCGVCACYPLLLLDEYFDLTLYYNNDNIYPFEEYKRRYEELLRVVEQFNKEHNTNVKVVKTDYDGENYLNKIAIYADEPERGQRCRLCFSLRMSKAYEYAEKNHFDYFTTVMTISRQKDSKTLNEIGGKLANLHPEVHYFFSDFKKMGGLEKGDAIANSLNLYRQNYCGCYYSYQAMLKRKQSQ